MVSRFAGATLGLLAFSVTVISGLLAGNPVAVTLSRALWAMAVFCVIGLLTGSAAQAVVNDHVKRRSDEILKAGAESSPTEESAAAEQISSTEGEAEPMRT